MTDKTYNFINSEVLNGAIAEMLGEKLSSEHFAELISTQLDKTITEIVRDSLRSYSPAAKAIEEAIKSSFMVSKIGIPAYGETIARIVREKVQERVDTEGAAHLQELLDEILKPAEIELKLSELIAHFIEYFDLHENGSTGEISLHVETSDYGSIWISFDREPNLEKYRCEYRLLVGEDGVVSSGSIESRKFDKAKPIFFGEQYGFARRLLNLHAAGTKLIIDEDACVTSYGPDY